MQVSGFNVPSGPQPYALVVDNGSIGAAPPPPTVQVHVGDLDGARAATNKSWSATVTVTVHDSNHAAISGATVAGTWTNASYGEHNLHHQCQRRLLHDQKQPQDHQDKHLLHRDRHYWGQS